MSRRSAAAGPLSTLHVAIDAHDLVRDDRGIGRYLRALVPRLQAHDDVRTTLLRRGPFTRVPRDAGVLWHPWNGTFLRARTPAVATIHDVAPFAFPDPDPRRRAHEQAPFRRSFAGAAALVADSAFTRDELVARCGVAPERITVVPLGVDAAFAPGALDALPVALHGRDYVLHVGAHDARKNTATLAAAHAAAFPHGDVALVLTRRPPFPVPGALVLDALDETALVACYRGALAVAVPSIYEGFGLPLLEAMACGAPVVAARAASLPEIGGDAVRWVETPTDVTAWSAALGAVAASDAERAALRERGLAQAAGFTWDRCAAATLAVLRRVARA